MIAKPVEAAGCSAPRSWRLRSAACRPRSFGEEVTPLGNIYVRQRQKRSGTSFGEATRHRILIAAHQASDRRVGQVGGRLESLQSSAF
jgi:hypothetical protein